MAQIVVDWAQSTKEPQSRAEYDLLYSSHVDRAWFRQLVDAANPGQPTTTQSDRAGGPPWVSFLPVDQTHCGIMLREVSENTDGFKRQILPSTFYLAPFDELARVGATFDGLYAAVRSAPLPLGSAEGIILDVPAPDLMPVAERVDRASFGSVAVAAMLLLDGPLTLIGGETLSLDERLAWLDAILALLPYGYRASISAAAWANGSHQLRLAFGAGTGAGHTFAVGQKPDTKKLPSDVISCAKALSEAQRDLGTLGILNFFQLDRAPRNVNDSRTMDSARQAAQTLQEIGDALAGVRKHSGSADAVRKVLDGRRSRGLKLRPEQLGPFVVDLIEPVLAKPAADDAEWLRPYWSHQLGAAVAARVVECLRKQNMDAADKLFQLAARIGHLDDVVAATMDVDTWAGVACVRRHLSSLPPTGAAASRLRRDMSTVSELCRQELTGDASKPIVPDRVVGTMTWLLAGGSRWLDPLKGLVSETAAESWITPATLTKIWTDCQSLGHAAIVVALIKGRANTVLQGAWPMLLQQPSPDLAQALSRLPITDPAIQAQCDTVLLVSGSSIPYTSFRTIEQNNVYMKMLHTLWQDAALLRSRGDLAKRFVVATLGQVDLSDWDEDWIRAAVNCGDDGLAGEVTTKVVDTVSSQEILGIKGIARLKPKNHRLLKIVALRSEKARRQLAMQDLHDAADRAADPESIANALAAARNEGGSAADMAEVLLGWARARPPKDLHDALLRADRSLEAIGGYFGLAREICQRDHDFGRAFRQWAFTDARQRVDRALHELAFYHHLVVFTQDINVFTDPRQSP